jgi:hypothetical protein
MYSQVIRQINSYLKGQSSKEQFEAWLYDVAFDVEENHTQRVIELVHELEGTLAEASSGHWPEYALRDELARISEEHSISCVVIYGRPQITGWASRPLQVHLASAM